MFLWHLQLKQEEGVKFVTPFIPLATPESWIFCVAVTTIMKFLSFAKMFKYTIAKMNSRKVNLQPISNGSGNLLTHHFKLTIFSPYLTSKYKSSSCTMGNLILIHIFITLLCWTQQRSRSIFLMQHLYYAKCYHMGHNTKQGNPVYNSTVPGYAAVNTSHSNILAIQWCVILLRPVNRSQKHNKNPHNCNSPNEDMRS